jgi:hypothetical protein
MTRRSSRGTEQNGGSARVNPTARIGAPACGPVGYPPETIMTRQQLATVLSTSEDSIERAGVPASYALGPRSPRYIWGDVIHFFRKGGMVT